MIVMRLDFEQSRLERARAALSGVRAGAETAVCRALNKAVKHARTASVRYICENYNIRPSEARRNLTVSLASRNKQNAQLVQRGSPLALSKFLIAPKKPPNQKGKKPEARARTIAGVRFGTRKELPHAFVARTRNGHLGVWSRAPEKGCRAIRQRYTTSVPQMLNNEAVMKRRDEEARQIMSAELDRQVDLILSGREKGKKS